MAGREHAGHEQAGEPEVESGDREGARAVRREGLHRDAAFELAGLLSERGEEGQAVTVLESLLREVPDDPDCLYNLACCHARNHNFDDSLHYLKSAVEFGFRDQDKIHADRDLQAIRQFKEYTELAGQAGLIG